MAQQDKFTINGTVDTNKSVWENIEQMAAACSAWPTFDSYTGAFSLVINEVTPSTFTFDDSNLLSEITFTTANISDAYNRGTIKFKSVDQVGKYDSISQQLVEQFNAIDYDVSDTEYPNILNLSNEFINNSVQADNILRTELKQSRRDRVIVFDSDYSAIGVQAGDVITITVSENAPRLRNQLYRVVEVQEVNSDQGEIVLRFTAIDYDDSTYDFTGLIRTAATIANPMPPIKSNTAIEEDKAETFANNTEQALPTTLPTGVEGAYGETLNKVFAAGGKKTPVQSINRSTALVCGSDTVSFTVQLDNCSSCFFNQPTFDYEYEITGLSNTTIDIETTGTLSIESGGTATVTATVENTGATLETMSFTIDGTTQTIDISPVTNEVNVEVTPTALCEGGTVSVSITPVSTCDILEDGYLYELTGIDASDVNIPLTGTIISDSLTIITQDDADIIDETMTVIVKDPAGQTISTQQVLIKAKLAFTYDVNADFTSVEEGSTATVTLTTTGVSDGTSVPYTIAGSTSRISTATSGNVTVTSNSATLAIDTINDSEYTGDQNITVTFNPDLVDPCGTLGTNSIVITIEDDETQPPEPPADYETEFVTIPLVYKGVFDGTTQYLKSVGVLKTATVPIASTGGITVPLTVSVENSGTSSAAISIDSTVNIVDDITIFGGSQLDVVTAFDAAPSGGATLITGTVTTVSGYVN